MTPRVAAVRGDPDVALRTRDLAVGYRARLERRALLERLNVIVRPGELVCVLGPNGIGKSALLRTIARMQPALWGAVEVAGVNVRSMTPTELARRVGVVLTERVLVDALPARRIIELGRYPHSGWFGRLTPRDREAVERAIDAVGAGHLADRDFSRLSDGERQRVMIARALAQEPSLLVLDEPTAFLDAPSRIEVMALLRQLTRGGRLAVVVSTHDLDLALRTADAAWLLMPGGELVAGAPEALVMTGALAQAFDGRQIRISQKENGSMRSISTMRGDGGETSLAGGVRVSKASARVDTYGTIDELNSTMGFARSICEDAGIAAFTKNVQQDLFKIGSSLATPPDSPKPQIVIDPALVDHLTSEVHRLEAIDGMLADWSLPGEHAAAAAFDVARTVCRRAERALVRLQESGADVQPAMLAYMNRLSDVLWLFGRKLERDAGVNGSLRAATGRTGNRFSRAW